MFINIYYIYIYLFVYLFIYLFLFKIKTSLPLSLNGFFLQRAKFDCHIYGKSLEQRWDAHW